MIFTVNTYIYSYCNTVIISISLLKHIPTEFAKELENHTLRDYRQFKDGTVEVINVIGRMLILHSEVERFLAFAGCSRLGLGLDDVWDLSITRQQNRFP